MDLCSNTFNETELNANPSPTPTVPKPKKERSRIRMLPFQKKKIIELVYGDQVLDLENPKAMKR